MRASSAKETNRPKPGASGDEQGQALPLDPGGWGMAGEPEVYDPGVPTGPTSTGPIAAGPIAAGPIAAGPAIGPAAAPPEGIGGAGGDIEYPQEVGQYEVDQYEVDQHTASPTRPVEVVMSSGEGTELPHWADPPTGEVPRALAGPASEDEMQAWRLLGSRGVHWRDDLNGWSDAPGIEDLVDGEEKPLTPEEAAPDPFSFDEDFERLQRGRAHRASSHGMAASPGPAVPDDAGTRAGPAGVPPPAEPGDGVSPPVLEAERAAVSSPRNAGPAAARNGSPAPASPTGPAQPARKAPYDVGSETVLGGTGRNVGAAIATGLGLIAVFVVCYLVGPVALLVLSALAIAGCAVEAFSMLQEVGFRPATLVGVLGSAGAVLAAYWKGTGALPIVMAVVLAATFVWYLARVVEARPLVNAAVTFLCFAWVGLFGSFAGLLLDAHKGGHLFFGAVVPTVLCDVAAWFVGSRLGAHHLAPHTSPGKTWEGAIAGAVVAVVAGAVIGHELSPWGGLRHGVELGVLIAVVAPIGDLVQSMIKRDLRLKDSGALLPGHGGLLDRFDSLLFVLPAVYFLALALHLAH